MKKPKQTKPKGRRVWVAVDRSGSVMESILGAKKKYAIWDAEEHMGNRWFECATIQRATLIVDKPRRRTK